jgi:hypothetical protein
MVILTAAKSPSRQRGMLSTDFAIAIIILMVAVIPLMLLYVQEFRMARALYHRAAVMAVVDGEMEVLIAGAWKSLPEGTSMHELSQGIIQDLPPGILRATRTPTEIRLEWTPNERHRGGQVARVWRME